MLEASRLSADGRTRTPSARRRSRGLHSKQVRLIEDQIRAHATTVVDDLIEAGDGDFVERVSKRLPMMTLWDMMGPRSPSANASRTSPTPSSAGTTRGRGDQEPIEMMFEAVMALTGARSSSATPAAPSPATICSAR